MLGKNAAESVKNIFCIEHVYNMAQNAVQKLAMALHSPPPSVDLKEARTLRIDARDKTQSLMWEDSTRTIPSSDPNDSNEVDTSGNMSLDEGNEED